MTLSSSLRKQHSVLGPFCIKAMPTSLYMSHRITEGYSFSGLIHKGLLKMLTHVIGDDISCSFALTNSIIFHITILTMKSNDNGVITERDGKVPPSCFQTSQFLSSSLPAGLPLPDTPPFHHPTRAHILCQIAWLPSCPKALLSHLFFRLPLILHGSA
jgi:hypothetical protein